MYLSGLFILTVFFIQGSGFNFNIFIYPFGIIYVLLGSFFIVSSVFGASEIFKAFTAAMGFNDAANEQLCIKIIVFFRKSAFWCALVQFVICIVWILSNVKAETSIFVVNKAVSISMLPFLYACVIAIVSSILVNRLERNIIKAR